MPVSRKRKKNQKSKKENKARPDRQMLFKAAITTYDERGLLPVRALTYNVQDLFFNISPDFKTEFDVEVSSGLHNKIVYKIDAEPVKEIAELTSHKEIGETTSTQKIIMHENYNQFLWSLCYSLLVLFDKGVHEPRLRGEFTGGFADTIPVREAWKIFKKGISLTSSFSRTEFFALPNPELDSKREYIGKANAIYCSALGFILLHEFGHHYYGHYNNLLPNPEQSKKDEFLADDFAIEKMERHFSGTNGKTLKGGILLGTLSLFFLDRQINGGDTHPDLDDRLRVVTERLDLDDLDNLWGIASLGLNLWAHHFEQDIKIPRIGENYKALFQETLKDLAHLK